MWCVGHSLGAHVCANVGMNTGQSIARVTGQFAEFTCHTAKSAIFENKRRAIQSYSNRS